MDPNPNGFWPNIEEPPKAGVEEAPKAGIELPKGAGDDEAPKVVVDEKGEDDWAVPNTPVEVPPNMELPVEPNGVVVVPKGLGANGLLLALFVCPKTDDDPNGLLDDCPKGLVEPNIFFSIYTPQKSRS